MRGTALGLGIAGGVIGLISAVMIQMFAAVGAGMGESFNDPAMAQDASEIMGLAWGAYFFSLLGIIGGAFALAKPRFAAAVLLFSAVGIVISISFGAIVAAPLLAIGSLMAFLGRSSKKAEVAAPGPQGPAPQA